MAAPQLFLFLHSFPIFLTFFFFFSGHTDHVLQVCVWVNFSFHDWRNHKSSQIKLYCHHQSGFWIQIQRKHLVCSCGLVFPELLSGCCCLSIEKDISGHLFPAEVVDRLWTSWSKHLLCCSWWHPSFKHLWRKSIEIFFSTYWIGTLGQFLIHSKLWFMHL